MDIATETGWSGSSVFAKNFEQKIGNAATFEDAEVFAPKHRYQAAPLSRTSFGNVIVLKVASQPLGKIYSNFENAKLLGGEQKMLYFPDPQSAQESSTIEKVRSPSWLQPVLASMANRWGVGYGWDTYDAKPTNVKCADQLLEYLLTIMLGDSTPPVITPLSDGGLQAEWHRNNIDFEIVISADEPARYYYFNAETNEEEENELDKQNLTSLHKFISNF